MKTLGTDLLNKVLAWGLIVAVSVLLVIGPHSSESELTLPSLTSGTFPFDFNACEGLEVSGPIPCVWEPGVVFASRITLQEFEELGAPGPNTIPRGMHCHTLTVQDQTMAVRRLGSSRLILVAVDAQLWPRFKASIRSFIGAQCPGT